LEEIKEANRELILTKELVSSEYVSFQAIQNKFDIEKIDARWCLYNTERVKLISQESFRRKVNDYISTINSDIEEDPNYVNKDKVYPLEQDL